jgi:hypothetical protein
VRVQTSKDRIACKSLDAIPETGKVTGVSLTIAAAQRVAGTKSGVVTVVFKTATALAGCADNTIVITVPANFFVADANPPLSSLTAGTVSGYTVAVATGSITLTGTNAVSAGVQGVTISGITFGVATNGVDTGVTVKTQTGSPLADVDRVSDGVPSGDLSGFMVKSVKTNGCGQACSTLTIVFSSLAAFNSGATDLITIVFPTGTSFVGTPSKFNMGGAVSSGQQVLVTPSVSSNTIILTPSAFNKFPTFDGTDVTIILSGPFRIVSTLATTLATRVSMNIVSAGTGTRTNQAMYMATGQGTTTTTQLSITRPFPGVTNTVVTVGFTTTSAMSEGDFARIFFPTGFFIAAPAVTTCDDAPTRGYTMKASDGSSCNKLTPENVGSTGEPITVLTVGSTTSYFDVTYTTGSSAAGKQSIVLSGVTLSAAAAPSSVAFYVVTTQDTCSAGMIATGAISNSNPGGPSAPGASTGTGVLLSLAVAIMCSLLFWL